MRSTAASPPSAAITSRRVAKGKMTREQLDRTLALIVPTLTYDGFDKVDIVTEAVFENMDLKKSTFADLGRVTRPECLLATNTSTLDIDRVRALERPARSASSARITSARPMS